MKIETISMTKVTVSPCSVAAGITLAFLRLGLMEKGEGRGTFSASCFLSSDGQEKQNICLHSGRSSYAVVYHPSTTQEAKERKSLFDLVRRSSVTGGQEREQMARARN